MFGTNLQNIQHILAGAPSGGALPTPPVAPRRSLGLGGFFDYARANPAAMASLGAGIMSGNTAGGLQAFGQYAQQGREERKAEAQRNKTLAFLQQRHPQLAEAVGAGMSIKDAFALSQERKAEAPKVQTFFDDNGMSYKAQWNSETGSWDKVGGSKGASGFEITTADGTTIRQGAFGNQDKKNVANRVTDAQKAAASASSLKQTVQMLRNANENTGYSGVGGNVYGAIDDTLEQMGAPNLPGNARSRSIVTSGGLDIALKKVEQTKGAISNAEMALFMAASPGMQNTQEGNAALLDMADAIADRAIARSQKMEQWRQQYGTLDGFEAAWGEFIEANPLIIADGQNGVKLVGQQPEGGDNDPLGIRGK